MFPHQNAVADDGTSLKETKTASLVRLGEPRPDKKRHKKGKRVKQRSGKGYD